MSLATLLISALAPAVLASGSPATGMQVRHPPDACPPQSCAIEPSRELSAEESREAMSVFAACMVDKYPDRIRELLDMPVADPKTREHMKALLKSRCVAKANAGLLAMSPLLLRGALFEALYARDFGNGDRIEAFSTAKPQYPVGQHSGGETPTDAQTQTYARLMTVGECVVRLAPTAARELISSGIGGKEEQTKVQAIARAIPRCTDKSMTLSKSILRMMIAEPLYRLSTLGAAGANANGKAHAHA